MPEFLENVADVVPLPIPVSSQAPRPQQQSMIEKQLSNIEKRLRPASPAWSLRLQDSLAKIIRRNVLQKAG